MSTSGKRVRWTSEERAALIRRSQSLHLQHPGWKLDEVLEQAQEVLPEERRRRGHYALKQWLRTALARADQLPSEPTIWRREEASPSAAVAAGAGTTQVPEQAESEATQSAAAASRRSSDAVLVDAIVEASVHVVVRIFSDPRVKAAAQQLFAQRSIASQHAPPDDPSPSSEDDPAAERHQYVVVAGATQDVAEKLEQSLGDTIPLKFWLPDDTREELQSLVDEARVVIGVEEGLTSAIASSLQRLGPRFVLHRNGSKSLYNRLAEEALR